MSPSQNWSAAVLIKRKVNDMQTRKQQSAALIADFLANGGQVTRIERGRRTVKSSDMKLAVRGDLDLRDVSIA
jgi:hypothetical protein